MSSERGVEETAIKVTTLKMVVLCVYESLHGNTDRLGGHDLALRYAL